MKQLMLTPKDYLGKEEAYAIQWAESKGFIVRIVEKDGNSKKVDAMDHRSDRINFRIKNGFVYDVYGG